MSGAGSIPITDAQQLFTKQLAAVFSDRLRHKAFLRSFFTEVESDTKNISIQVQRNNEPIAVDVIRGGDGNRNSFAKSTEKIWTPPYFDEYFELTELQSYDELYVNPNSTIALTAFGRFLNEAADKLDALCNKIDRSYELQCAQVLQQGIITLKSADSIDFKRQADSMVDLGSGHYWTETTVDPNDTLEAAGKWLRETGKMSGSVVNVIMGSKAFTTYLNNTKVQNRGKTWSQFTLDGIMPAQRDAKGQSFHGEVSAGSYRFRLFTYPEIYTAADGTKTKYIDDNTIICVPETTSFTLSYAAVPQLLSTGIKPVKGKFIFYNYIDEKLVNHMQGVRSAGLAIPTAVDQIYTAQVVATV